MPPLQFHGDESLYFTLPHGLHKDHSDNEIIVMPVRRPRVLYEVVYHAVICNKNALYDTLLVSDRVASMKKDRKSPRKRKKMRKER